ncbi:hypothetical protein [Niabella ginsengisoli]|uniref:Uncharacterized protein n=1 Tax=Niabella ginsengisoli TaxID=522298 RepID=A0ABS9SKQ2_9BACT|nr:hypothetical protein [Niabella ginsengisoli]MCH5598959.1 hypothetical protein [Niabella ginsengisoli]
MFQPYSPFEFREIDLLRKTKRRFVVLQTCDLLIESKHDNKKLYLMLTDYDALANARGHKNSITNDKHAIIFDLENDSHRNKLTEMLYPDSKYFIYRSTIANGTSSRIQHELV